MVRGPAMACGDHARPPSALVAARENKGKCVKCVFLEPLGRVELLRGDVMEIAWTLKESDREEFLCSLMTRWLLSFPGPPQTRGPSYGPTYSVQSNAPLHSPGLGREPSNPAEIFICAGTWEGSRTGLIGAPSGGGSDPITPYSCAPLPLVKYFDIPWPSA